MLEESVASFAIRKVSLLSPAGVLLAALPATTADPTLHLALYRMMRLQRVFDQKAINLQRTGKMGTYPSSLGQEAYSVGIGAAMQKEDVLCPYYREQGAQLWRGVAMEEILLYWGGDETGSNFSGAREDFPICVPIASQTLHAVGVATAFQIRNQPRVAVTTIGDGGTSRGDFYEAMNVAGVWKLPVVFVINNNRWAISVPLHMQTACETLAQKAIAAGIPAIQVDGNDALAMHAVMAEALAHARKGLGPMVIEALSYRMGDHTTADDATRYRAKEEVEKHRAEDPIERLQKYLLSTQVINPETDKAMLATIDAEVQAATERYLNTPHRTPESMFDCLYAELPEAYAAERAALKEGAVRWQRSN